MRSTSVTRPRGSFISLALLSVLSGAVLSVAQDKGVKGETSLLRSLDERSESSASVVHQGVLNPTVVELQISRAWSGDETARSWLAQQLPQGLSAIDPVWGGAYEIVHASRQPSEILEKSLAKQAEYTRIYSQAAFAFDNPRYRDVAVRVAEFSLQNLWPTRQAFYVAQRTYLEKRLSAAEYLLLRDVQRQDIAMPSLVKETSTSTNAQMVEALCALYASTGEERFLLAAQEVMEWLEEHLGVPAKGEQPSQAQLLEQSFVASAAIRMYAVMAGRPQLRDGIERLSRVAMAVLEEKKAASTFGGQAQLARVLNLGYRYSGRSELLAASQKIARGLRQRESLVLQEDEVARVLLEQELKGSPTRITLVGAKGSKVAQDLWKASLRYDVPYKRQEWFDANEGAPMNPDKQLPALAQPAVFFCAEERCSVALFTEADVKEKIGELFPPL